MQFDGNTDSPKAAVSEEWRKERRLPSSDRHVAQLVLPKVAKLAADCLAFVLCQSNDFLDLLFGCHRYRLHTQVSK